MEKHVSLLKEFESLMGSDNPADIKRKEEIVKMLEATDSPEQRQSVREMLNRQMDVVERSLEEVKKEVLRSQIDDKAYKLIPWSYIAKEYFGKSVSWLTQRINGYTVRGQVYTLNEEQKATLNRALSEIGSYIGSYHFA